MLGLKSVKTKTKKSGCGRMENAGGETRSHTLQAWATSQGFTAAFPYGMLFFSSLLKEGSI